MMSRFVTTSEKNLLHIHYVLVSNVKFIKKFFRKGQMMKAFEYIRSLYNKKNFKAIERVQEVLVEKMPNFHGYQYNKYSELIEYCQLLLDSRTLPGWDLHMHANDMIAVLDTNHELGRCIQEHILVVLARA
jgi:hypothetical protein